MDELTALLMAPAKGATDSDKRRLIDLYDDLLKVTTDEVLITDGSDPKMVPLVVYGRGLIEALETLDGELLADEAE